MQIVQNFLKLSLSPSRWFRLASIAGSLYFTLISDTLVAYHSRDKNPSSANYVTKENRVSRERSSKFISRYLTIAVIDLKRSRRKREKGKGSKPDLSFEMQRNENKERHIVLTKRRRTMGLPHLLQRSIVSRMIRHYYERKRRHIFLRSDLPWVKSRKVISIYTQWRVVSLIIRLRVAKRPFGSEAHRFSFCVRMGRINFKQHRPCPLSFSVWLRYNYRELIRFNSVSHKVNKKEKRVKNAHTYKNETMFARVFIVTTLWQRQSIFQSTHVFVVFVVFACTLCDRTQSLTISFRRE